MKDLALRVKSKFNTTVLCELLAYGVLGLIALAFPVMLFYVIPLVILDTAAPAIVGNYFTS